MGVVVVSGGTNGMGRALSLARAERGDRVVVLGRNRERGEALAGGLIEFLPADLSRVAEARRVVDEILARFEVVDALALFANGMTRHRTVTDDGLERTFALYYVSRHILGFGLRPALDRAPAPVIVNVAGVGTRRGEIHWDDLRLERKYSTIRAQLQAGRANDLLGVGFARRSGSRARYVLFHPGFTRSGEQQSLPVVTRGLIKLAAAVAAQPVPAAVAPIHGFLDHPPDAPLTAVDRTKTLPLDFPTLDPARADRLLDVTEQLLRRRG